MEKLDPTVIPPGPYCYTFNGVNRVLPDGRPAMGVTHCPYWMKLPGKPEQGDGYCAFLGIGDWDEVEPDGKVIRGTFLLWDSVKECGVNDDDYDIRQT